MKAYILHPRIVRITDSGLVTRKDTMVWDEFRFKYLANGDLEYIDYGGLDEWTRCIFFYEKAGFPAAYEQYEVKRPGIPAIRSKGLRAKGRISYEFWD